MNTYKFTLKEESTLWYKISCNIATVLLMMHDGERDSVCVLISADVDTHPCASYNLSGVCYIEDLYFAQAFNSAGSYTDTCTYSLVVHLEQWHPKKKTTPPPPHCRHSVTSKHFGAAFEVSLYER